MSLPRLVLSPHPMGRVLGAPGDVARQREILLQALALLDSPSRPPQTIDIAGGYRPPQQSA